MSDSKSNIRIDQILVWDNQVTEAQIREALKYQKAYGGKLGSHLVRMGHLDEAGLVKALSKQYNCDGVVLGNIEIHESVIALVPASVATTRIIMPFDFDPKLDLLKIACEDPFEAGLAEELTYIAQGKKIKLFVAAELSLKAAIAKYYYSGKGAESARITQVQPDTARNLRVPHPPADLPRRGWVLLVTDDLDSDHPLRLALEQDNYGVDTADSADSAIDVIGRRSYHTVFIRDSVQGDYLELVDRLRKLSPSTRVRYYESTAGILLDDVGAGQADLVVSNLDLLTTLLSSKDNRPVNHSGVVGQYADKLARQLKLPTKDRLVIVTAAYLHDLSRAYYGTPDDQSDGREAITLTIKLLDSLNTSPLVIGILKAMYLNLRDKYTRRIPIEALGGNILTIVDIFCTNVRLDEKMSLDKFEVLRTKFHELTGKLFLKEVVEAFLAVIEAEMLILPARGRYNQVMIFCDDAKLGTTVEARLRKEGYRAVVEQTPHSLKDLYDRGAPDMMVLVVRGEPGHVGETIKSLVAAGIQLNGLPVFLLVDAWVTPHLTHIFDSGVEDLLPLDTSFDLLVAKLKKVQARLESAAEEKDDLHTSTGAIGNLEDINLIDLLQAMGPGRKTVRITLSQPDREIVIYLQDGQIVHAAGLGKSGPEAVYEGITWTKGFWATHPVQLSEIPPQNSFYSNESILMEGCRLFDERLRAGLLQ